MLIRYFIYGLTIEGLTALLIPHNEFILDMWFLEKKLLNEFSEGG
ncbi:hypothetical protein QE443_004794 [Pantoea ananatis]|jgi:hypothetical protein|nr:hypothetical protein [Pantoea ananatis]MDR6092686.1 hypothetical protein [Pantoea ananatis]